MTDMKPSAEAQANDLVADCTLPGEGYPPGFLARLTESAASYLTNAHAQGRASRDAEIREAVEREREACYRIADDFLGDPDTCTGIALAIRSRVDRT
jgi:hypothetical protein